MEPVTGLAVNIKAEYIVGLAVLAAVCIVLMWCMFWHTVAKSQDSVIDVLKSPSFFKGSTVIGVIAATAVLSLAGRLDGNVSGAILSGIVGYVLGQLSGREVEKKVSEP